MQVLATLLLAIGMTHAHYTFSDMIVDGKSSGDWVTVRKTRYFQNINRYPLTDVNSVDIRCDEISTGTASQTIEVTAGSTIAFKSSMITHQGPLSFYIAKVPAGKTAATFDGSGNVWVKLWHEQPKWTAGGMELQWASYGAQRPSVVIPKCIPNGEYLLRIEHINLDPASKVGGAEFYPTCGQIRIKGGGSKQLTGGVAFPGAYSPTDPGILVQVYPAPASYQNPGPAPFSC